MCTSAWWQYLVSVTCSCHPFPVALTLFQGHSCIKTVESYLIQFKLCMDCETLKLIMLIIAFYWLRLSLRLTWCIFVSTRTLTFAFFFCMIINSVEIQPIHTTFDNFFIISMSGFCLKKKKVEKHCVILGKFSLEQVWTLCDCWMHKLDCDKVLLISLSYIEQNFFCFIYGFGKTI